MFLAKKVLMIEPRGFAFNTETMGDNFFQSPADAKNIEDAALKEFNNLREKLTHSGVEVITFAPVENASTPDAVFPNNWFSTAPSGQLFIYPMMAPNRRMERNSQVTETLMKDYKEVIDLSPMEKDGFYLEGTGSLVIDHDDKTAYAAISKRTTDRALEEWKNKTGYEIISFSAIDSSKEIIYHTNVMLTLGDGFAIACLDAISDGKEREIVRAGLSKNRELITITREQVNSFCGNCLALANSSGEKLIVMSSRSWQAFTVKQKCRLIRYVSIIHSDLSMIERIGGGSARCMMAELF